MHSGIASRDIDVRFGVGVINAGQPLDQLELVIFDGGRADEGLLFVGLGHALRVWIILAG